MSKKYYLDFTGQVIVLVNDDTDINELIDNLEVEVNYSKDDADVILVDVDKIKITDVK